MNVSTNTGHGSSPLLLLILLVVLVQPFLLIFALSDSGESTKSADPALVSAIEELSRAVKLMKVRNGAGASASAPDAASSDRLTAALDRLERSLVASPDGRPPRRLHQRESQPSDDGAEAGPPTTVEKRDEEQQSVVDVVIAEEMTRKEMRKGIDSTRYLNYSREAILSLFGTPDVTYVQNWGFSWQFRGERGRFHIDFADGRVVRFRN